MMEYEPKVVFHTGDLVDTSHHEWVTFNAITSELREKSEFYPVLGNHEYYAGLESFLDNFELPNNEKWYSVGRGGIHFIVLNSNDSIEEGSEQYAWLVSDLKSIGSSVKFTIVIFHHPPFSSTYSVEGDIRAFRYIAVPLFEKYGVDIVFNGHTHAYERCLYNDIYYITTGGGGAPLHKRVNQYRYSQKYVEENHFCILYIKDNRLFVEVLNEDLKLIDKFSVD